jgi:signal transduction histidine kinase/class 3 adenylate cyclase
VRRLFSLWLLLIGLLAALPALAAPAVQDGIVDLRGWDPERDGPVALDGEWSFWWGQLVDPSAIATGSAPTRDGVLAVPGMWPGLPRPGAPDEALTAEGHATYAARVLLPPPPDDAEDPRLDVLQRMVEVASRVEVRLPDGRRLARIDIGTPGADAEAEVPLYLDDSDQLAWPASGEVWVVWHVSNHRKAKGGVYVAPTLGPEGWAARQLWIARLRDMLVVGALLIMTLYHVAIVVQRREDRGSLWFALVCGASCVRQLVISRAVELQATPNDALWTALDRIEYMTIPALLVSFPGFVYHLAPRPWFLWAWRLYFPAAAVFVAVILVSPPAVYGKLLVPYELLVLASTPLVTGHLLVEWVRGNRVAGVSLAATGLFGAAVVNDVLNSAGLLSNGYFSVHGFFAFVLIQSYILASRFASAYRTAERLTRNLQQEVDARTSELALQAAQLRVLDAEKTVFFQNVSHELRTPLTLLLNPLEQKHRADPSDRDLETASRNARRLLRLVNQLLDFQKLTAGKKELRLQALPIGAFVQRCGAYVRSAAEHRGIGFEVVVAGAEDLVVACDLDSLEKVVFNYLSNALKYTPDGGRVTVGVERRDGRARLFVRDSGAGIAADQQDKLFRTFSQVDGTATRAHEGTGLGLALVKQLVERMGGEVGVISAPGAGSTFWAELPLHDGPAEPIGEDFRPKDWLLDEGRRARAAPVAEDPGQGDGAVILVVDDNDDLRDLIGATLKRRGWRVIFAADGERGVEVALERRPDLVVTDWMMPKLTGPDLIARLRARPETATTPMVLLTARSDEESRVVAVEGGADAFLGKPFNEVELVALVRNLLDLKRTEKELARTNEYITESVLKRYLPPSVVSEILAGRLSMDQPARLADVTVLFSDLAGFTSMSERLGPEVTATLLNEYLTAMNEVIFEHGGTIDKFIGDAIMVLFGVPKAAPAEEQVRAAVACAKAMQARLEALSAAWSARGLPVVRMRIGVNHGPAVVGNFGSSQRSDFTAIGPTVNLASRIEGACTPGEVYVSEAVARLLSDVAPAGEHQLKGIDGTRPLYRVVDPELVA